MSETENQLANEDVISLTADVVSAFVSHNSVSVDEISSLIQSTHAAFTALNSGQQVEEAKQEPAVPVRRSIHQDYIVCLEDGKKMKTMRRYIMRKYGLTPEDYRAKWDLPRDYPMTAPAYSQKRAEMAKKIGLGRKGRVAQDNASDDNSADTQNSQSNDEFYDIKNDPDGAGAESNGRASQDEQVEQVEQSNDNNAETAPKNKSAKAKKVTDATAKARGGKTGRTRRTKAEMEAARAAGEAKPKKSAKA